MNRKVVCRIEKSILLLIITLVLVFTSSWIVSGMIDSSNANAKEELQSYKYYTSIQIKQGDSLWSIADTYMSDDYKDIDTYIKEVRQLNDLYSDSIHAGEYITIPYYSTQYL